MSLPLWDMVGFEENVIKMIYEYYREVTNLLFKG